MDQGAKEEHPRESEGRVRQGTVTTNRKRTKKAPTPNVALRMAKPMDESANSSALVGGKGGEWVAHQDYIWGQQEHLYPSMIVRQRLREGECVH